MNPETRTSTTVQCANCGGELTYDATAFANKCEYCGSKFPINNDIEAESKESLSEHISIIPFKTDREQFRREMMKWMITANNAPLDILSISVYGEIHQYYIPMYFYTGSYEGSWSGYQKVSSGQGREVTDGAQVLGNFNATAPGENVSVVIAALSGQYIKSYGSGNRYAATAINTKAFNNLITNYKLPDDVVPATKNIDKKYTVEKFELSSDDAWDRFGRDNAARSLYESLNQQYNSNGTQDIVTDVKFSIKSVTKVLIPFWIAENHYKSVRFVVGMDGLNLNTYGTGIADSKLKPLSLKRKVIKFICYYFLAFLVEYLAAINIVVVFASITVNTPGININSLFKDVPLSLQKFIFSLQYIFPLIAARYLYKKQQKERENYQQMKNKQLEDILSGKIQLRYME